MKRIAFLALAVGAPVLLAEPAFAVKKKPADNQQQQQQQDGQADGQSKPDDKAYEVPFPTKMNWILSTINDKPPAAEATLSIDDTYRGAGNSGCNTWSAALYPQRGHTLAMGPVAMTKRSCTPELNAFEHLFLTVLATRPSWNVDGSTLTIKSQAGTLVFNRGL